MVNFGTVAGSSAIDRIGPTVGLRDSESSDGGYFELLLAAFAGLLAHLKEVGEV